MTKRAWYRSLYWRIGLGFVVFLAAVLAVQGLTLVWLISRMEVAPGPPPPEVARLVARELGEALSTNPQLDIEQFLRQRYGGRQPLVVVMRDGRVISSDETAPSDEVVTGIRARLNTDPESFLRMARGERRRGPRGPRPDGREPEGGRGRGPGFFGGPPRGGGPPGPIVVNGEVAGVVVANPHSTFDQLGLTLLAVGALLVVLGTISAALLIFGPARRRLQSLEEAARKVGSGDLTARAREDGGDEVATVAHAFNQMTTDLAARAAQLEAADRTRRLLLADVSHELMTPLTAMRGYLETLSMHAQALNPETRDRYLAIIQDETRRVEHIVGDLLDLARLEGGGDSLELQDVPLEDLFGRVVARHEREAAQKSVTITTNIAPGAEIVTGDPMRLEQAFQNLAANALRHTPPGGSITLGAELDSREVVISIRDTGSGMSPEHLAHVFDRFYKIEPSRGAGAAPRQARPSTSSGRPELVEGRDDTAGSSAVGSGLGLSIVKAIVERHRGTISVASRRGEGTWFTIRLPLA